MNAERVEDALICLKKAHAIIREINILQHMSIAQYRLGDKEGAQSQRRKHWLSQVMIPKF